MIRRARFIGLLALGTSIVLSSVAQLCLKAGTQKMRVAAGGHLPEFAWSSIEPAAVWIVIGLGAYLLSFASWLVVLVRYQLSFAYPLLGLSYVLVYLGATHWTELAESATPMRTIGTLFVVAGVGLLSLAGPRMHARKRG